MTDDETRFTFRIDTTAIARGLAVMAEAVHRLRVSGAHARNVARDNRLTPAEQAVRDGATA